MKQLSTCIVQQQGTDCTS